MERVSSASVARSAGVSSGGSEANALVLVHLVGWQACASVSRGVSSPSSSTAELGSERGAESAPVLPSVRMCMSGSIALIVSPVPGELGEAR